MRHASGRDLAQFKLWYSQAGTPRLRVDERWEDGRYVLELAQETPPTPGQPEKAPLVVPVAYGLLDRAGGTLAEGVLELSEARQSFAWELPERPVPSLLLASDSRPSRIWFNSVIRVFLSSALRAGLLAWMVRSLTRAIR